MRFFFKWMDSKDFTALDTIEKSDLDILDFTLKQREGEIALCSLTVPLTATLREGAYGLLFVDDHHKRTPLFFGKLMGLPVQINDFQQQIELFALPHDYLSQLQVLKQEIQQSEDWDELFIDEDKRDDPNEILEARPELFCWHPVTHKIVLSNFFEGRRKRTFDEAQILQESLRMKIADLPKPYINLSIIAEWVQEAEGEINLLPHIEKKFTNERINTLTPKGLMFQWPRRGQVLGRSGYAVIDSAIQPFRPLSTGVLGLYPYYTDKIVLEEEGGGGIQLKQTWFTGKLKLGWCYKQRRREVVKCKLANPFQLKGRFESKKLDLTLKLSDLTGHLQSPDCPSFFETDRGKKAIRHALKIASCHLAPSLRTHEVSIKVPICEALDLSLDESVTIRHPALKQGQVTGKLASYKIFASFEKSWAQLKIFLTEGSILEVPDFNLTPESDLEGLPLPASLKSSDFIEAIDVRNEAATQRQLIQKSTPKNRDELKKILQENQTEIVFSLKDIRSKDVMERCFLLDFAQSKKGQENAILSEPQ